MTLFSYDHCPYCVKARMIFGFKKVPFELVTLLNDDEDGPISMIGQKMLPILKKEDGSFLPESMDIVAYIDHLPEFGGPRVQASKNQSELNQYLKDMRQYHYALAMPRWPYMGLAEFATESARQYFTRKKEMAIGPFEIALQKTQALIAQAHNHLAILEERMSDSPYLWGEKLNADDFHLFASLRCLTTTQGVQFPDKVNAYMNRLSLESGVSLHWDQALGKDFHV